VADANRIPVPLILPEEPPTQAEIDLVLLTVDALPGKLDRKDIVFILKGSRRSRALFNQWYKLETFGSMHHLNDYRIGQTVDWCIHDGLLQLVINPQGEMKVYFDKKGWERNKDIWKERILDWFGMLVDEGKPEDVWPRIKPIHPEIKQMVLEHISRLGNRRFEPVLAAWEAHEENAEIKARIEQLLGAG
jgi:hypothetical protein